MASLGDLQKDTPEPVTTAGEAPRCGFRKPALDARPAVLSQKPAYFLPIAIGEQALNDQVAIALRVEAFEVVFLKEGPGGFGNGCHKMIIQQTERDV